MNSINKKMFRKALILSMEKVVARSCYNGNIQNYGAWGVREDEGRFFRFPLTVFNSDGSNQKTKSPDVGISLDSLKSSYYKFGANQLHVVEALDFILENLENEYGLDIYKNAGSSYVPNDYMLLKAETIFEATVSMGASSGGWIFNKPLARDVFESPEGVKYVYIREGLQPIRSSALMKKIVEGRATSEKYWHSFQSPRPNDQKYYSFVELGTEDDIKKLYSLFDGKS